MGVYECCCGSGGDVWALDLDVAIEAGRERAKELARKARTIATSCPVCYMVLRYATLREDLNVEVKDTVEFLKEYLDEAGKKGR